MSICDLKLLLLQWRDLETEETRDSSERQSEGSDKKRRSPEGRRDGDYQTFVKEKNAGAGADMGSYEEYILGTWES